MQYPINYDFGANWKSNIVPYLDNPIIKKAIRVGINDYLYGFPGNKKYKANTCPADYSSRDGYDMSMCRKFDIYLEKLEKEGKLPKKYVDLKIRDVKWSTEIVTDSSDSEEDYEDVGLMLFEMKEKMKSTLYQWKNIKYDLESYHLSGGCHSYAPTFEIALARLVEPDEKWMVRTSDKHSTVINESETKMFDFLYWGAFGELDKYMFGDECIHDETFGGKQAYLDTSDESSMDVITFNQFEEIAKSGVPIGIKIPYYQPIACYPKNTIMLLKVNNCTKYLLEARYNNKTGQISPPVY